MAEPSLYAETLANTQRMLAASMRGPEAAEAERQRQAAEKQLHGAPVPSTTVMPAAATPIPTGESLTLEPGTRLPKGTLAAPVEPPPSAPGGKRLISAPTIQTTVGEADVSRDTPELRKRLSKTRSHALDRALLAQTVHNYNPALMGDMELADLEDSWIPRPAQRILQGMETFDYPRRGGWHRAADLGSLLPDVPEPERYGDPEGKSTTRILADVAQQFASAVTSGALQERAQETQGEIGWNARAIPVLGEIWNRPGVSPYVRSTWLRGRDLLDFTISKAQAAELHQRYAGGEAPMTKAALAGGPKGAAKYATDAALRALSTDTGREIIGLGLEMALDPLWFIGTGPKVLRAFVGGRKVLMGEDAVRASSALAQAEDITSDVARLRTVVAAEAPSEKVAAEFANGAKALARKSLRADVVAKEFADAAEDPLQWARAVEAQRTALLSRRQEMARSLGSHKTVDGVEPVEEIARIDRDLERLRPHLDAIARAKAHAALPVAEQAGGAARATSYEDALRAWLRAGEQNAVAQSEAIMEQVVNLNTFVRRMRDGSSRSLVKNVGHLGVHIPLTGKAGYIIGTGGKSKSGAKAEVAADLMAHYDGATLLARAEKAAKEGTPLHEALTEGEQLALAHYIDRTAASGERGAKGVLEDVVSLPGIAWEGLAKTIGSRWAQPAYLRSELLAESLLGANAPAPGRAVLGGAYRLVKKMAPAEWEQAQRAISSYMTGLDAANANLMRDLERLQKAALRALRVRKGLAKRGQGNPEWGKKAYTIDDILLEAASHRERGSGGVAAELLPSVHAYEAYIAGVRNATGRTYEEIQQALLNIARKMTGDPEQFARLLDEARLSNPIVERVIPDNWQLLWGDTFTRGVARWEAATDALREAVNSVSTERLAAGLIRFDNVARDARVPPRERVALMESAIDGLFDTTPQGRLLAADFRRGIAEAFGVSPRQAGRALYNFIMGTLPTGSVPTPDVVSQAVRLTQSRLNAEVALLNHLVSGTMKPADEIATVQSLLHAQANRRLAALRALVGDDGWDVLRTAYTHRKDKQALAVLTDHLVMYGGVPAESAPEAARAAVIEYGRIIRSAAASATLRSGRAQYLAATGKHLTMRVLNAGFLHRVIESAFGRAPGASGDIGEALRSFSDDLLHAADEGADFFIHDSLERVREAVKGAVDLGGKDIERLKTLEPRIRPPPLKDGRLPDPRAVQAWEIDLWRGWRAARPYLTDLQKMQALTATLRAAPWLPENVNVPVAFRREYAVMGQRYGKLPEDLAPVKRELDRIISAYEERMIEQGREIVRNPLYRLKEWGLVDFVPHMMDPAEALRRGDLVNKAQLVAGSTGRMVKPYTEMDRRLATEVPGSVKRAIEGAIDEINATEYSPAFAMSTDLLLSRYIRANKAMEAQELLLAMLRSGVLRQVKAEPPSAAFVQAEQNLARLGMALRGVEGYSPALRASVEELLWQTAQHAAAMDPQRWPTPAHFIAAMRIEGLPAGITRSPRLAQVELEALAETAERIAPRPHPLLQGPEGQRVEQEIRAMHVAEGADDAIERALAIAEGIADDAVRANPERYPNVEAFFKRLRFESVDEFDPARAVPDTILFAPEEGTTRTRDGDAFFSDLAFRMARSEAAGHSRVLIVHMNPNEFLALARYAIDADKTQRVRGMIERGEQFEGIPMLQVDTDTPGEIARVVGHEGRHRARALAERGITDMPVRIRASSHRWSAETVHPRQLIPEEGATSDAPRAFPGVDAEGGLVLFQKNTGRSARVLKAAQDAEILTPAGVLGIIGAKPGSAAMPEYLRDVLGFILARREKILTEGASLREIAKAYVIGVASMGASEQHVAGYLAPRWERAGLAALTVDPRYAPDGMLRPEDMAAIWLGSPTGRQALDDLEKGLWNAEAWEELTHYRAAYGRPKDLRNIMAEAPEGKYTLRNLQAFAERFNAAIKEGPDAMFRVQQDLLQVGNGKAPFMSWMLGFGEKPTIDGNIARLFFTKGSAVGADIPPVTATGMRTVDDALSQQLHAMHARGQFQGRGRLGAADFANRVQGDYVEGVAYFGEPRQRVYHSWVEEGDTVYDTHLNLAMPKDDYYRMLGIEKVKRTAGATAFKRMQSRKWRSPGRETEGLPHFKPPADFVVEDGRLVYRGDDMARALLDDIAEVEKYQPKIKALIRTRIEDVYSETAKALREWGVDLPPEAMGALIHHWLWDRLLSRLRKNPALKTEHLAIRDAFTPGTTLFQADDDIIMGATFFDPIMRKVVAQVTQHGDIGTLFHEQHHALLGFLFGADAPTVRDVFTRLYGKDGVLTTEGLEQAAEHYRVWLQRQTLPSLDDAPFLQRIFERVRAFAVSVLERLQGMKGGIPKEAAALYEQWLQKGAEIRAARARLAATPQPLTVVLPDGRVSAVADLFMPGEAILGLVRGSADVPSLATGLARAVSWLFPPETLIGRELAARIAGNNEEALARVFLAYLDRQAASKDVGALGRAFNALSDLYYRMLGWVGADLPEVAREAAIRRLMNAPHVPLEGWSSARRAASQDLVPLLSRPNTRMMMDLLLGGTLEDWKAAGVSQEDVLEALQALRHAKDGKAGKDMTGFAAWLRDVPLIRQARDIEHALGAIRADQWGRDERLYSPLLAFHSYFAGGRGGTAADAWEHVANDLKILGSKAGLPDNELQITGEYLAAYYGANGPAGGLYLPASLYQSLNDIFSDAPARVFGLPGLKQIKWFADKTNDMGKRVMTITNLAFHMRNLWNMASVIADVGVGALNPSIQRRAAQAAIAGFFLRKFGTMEEAQEAVRLMKAGVPAPGETLWESATAPSREMLYSALWDSLGLDDVTRFGLDMGDGVRVPANEAFDYLERAGVISGGYANPADIEYGTAGLLRAWREGSLKKIMRWGGSVYDRVEDAGIVGMSFLVGGPAGMLIAMPKNAGREVAQFIENQSRLVSFFANMRKWGDREEAARHVAKFLFNYGDLMPFQKVVLRTIFPFWTWNHGNIGLHLNLMHENPMWFQHYNRFLLFGLPRVLAAAQRDITGEPYTNARPFSDQDMYLRRPFERARVKLPYPFMPNVFISGTGSPLEAFADTSGALLDTMNPVNLIRPFTSGGGHPSYRVLAWTHWLGRWALEELMERSLFRDQPLGDLTDATPILALQDRLATQWQDVDPVLDYVGKNLSDGIGQVFNVNPAWMRDPRTGMYGPEAVLTPFAAHLFASQPYHVTMMNLVAVADPYHDALVSPLERSAEFATGKEFRRIGPVARWSDALFYARFLQEDQNARRLFLEKRKTTEMLDALERRGIAPQATINYVRR